MAGKVECLFSLELVVEKLYLPHVVCRFPAVAFRLLDFPTILIRHVEPDLGKRIKASISSDPDYEVPIQFSELKDKNGNFMVKKGKSCLFKISLEALRTHLKGTPLYVMVVDNFTEVPKLLGNSTVPLDTLIGNINNDMRKVGNSIPSVHGDKRLFNIYNLMGKEVGYMTLGYRLLSIGPSLVPHLSDQTLFTLQNNQPEELPKLDSKPAEEINSKNCPSGETAWTSVEQIQQSGAKTDEFKEDKGTCVNIDNDEFEVIPEKKTTYSISTQTFRKPRAKSSWFQKISPKDNKLISEDEDFSATNVSCPPPLFFQADKNKKVQWLNRGSMSPYFPDTNFENYSDIVSEVDDENVSAQSREKEDLANHETADQIGMSRKAIQSEGVINDNAGENVFPLLSALFFEISRLQVPHHTPNFQIPLQQNSHIPPEFFNMVRSSANKVQRQGPACRQNQRSFVPSGKKHIPKIMQEGNKSEAVVISSADSKTGRLSHRSCSGDHQHVPKNKSWLRRIPAQEVKKSKLTYGMTNTQRLRLARGNPQLFRAMELQKMDQHEQQQLKTPQEEFEEGNLSDMSTEIRRHTLDNIELNSQDETVLPFKASDKIVKDCDHKDCDADRSRVSFGKSVENIPLSPKSKCKKVKPRSPAVRESKHSLKPKHAKKRVKESIKQGVIVNIATSDSNEDNNQVSDKGTEDSPRHLPAVNSGEAAVGLIPDLPQYKPYELHLESESDHKDGLSHRSQKSIEVCLPSAELLSADESNLSSPGRPENSASKMSKLNSFVGFLGKTKTDYWDTVEANKPPALGEEDDNDMENLSYVPSWGMSSEFEKQPCSSAVFSSTGDSDTRLFQSTEEQELLDWISNADEISFCQSVHSPDDTSGKTKSSDKASASTVLKIPVLNPLLSESSPVPSTRRSIARVELSVGPVADRETTLSTCSSKQPTPLPHSRIGRELAKKESIHTESVSTYAPSDIDNVNTSMASDPTYSEDFHNMESDGDETEGYSPIPNFIPTTKLGYTIS